MALNIKSREADELVEALAELTGESKTRAVIEALRERLERHRQQQDRNALTAELLTIGERCASFRRPGSEDHDELLYDERGLPR